MNDYQTIKIASNFSVELDSTPRKIDLSDDVRRQVEDIWNEEKKLNPMLFNGSILNVSSYSKERILGQFVEYKHFMAQRRLPALKKQLQLHVLAITGVTVTSQHVLIGKRSKYVSHYPGLYELTPSGGVDADAFVGHHVDYREQIQRELEEETGYKPQQIEEIQPLYLIIEESCIDIVAVVKLRISDLAIKATKEYEELMWIARDKVHQFVDRHHNQMVPLSMYLIRKLF